MGTAAGEAQPPAVARVPPGARRPARLALPRSSARLILLRRLALPRQGSAWRRRGVDGAGGVVVAVVEGKGPVAAAGSCCRRRASFFLYFQKLFAEC